MELAVKNGRKEGFRCRGGGVISDDRINKPLDWITSLVKYVREQIKKVRNLQDGGKNREGHFNDGERGEGYLTKGRQIERQMSGFSAPVTTRFDPQYWCLYSYNSSLMT